MRGIVALGSITLEEFSEAFSRWQPTLRRIAPAEVADEVYAAMRPGIVAALDRGGYQTVRFTVRPKTVRCVVRPPLGLKVAIHPMPVLL